MNRKRRSTVYRKPLSIPSTAFEIIEEPYIKNRNVQYKNLKDMKDEMIGMVRNIEKLEVQMKSGDGGLHDKTAIPSNSSWKRVRICTWNNQAQVPHYM